MKILFTLILMTLISCGSKHTSHDAATTADTNVEVIPKNPTLVETTNNLIGTWSSTCSEQTSYEYTFAENGDVTLRYQIYEDDDACLNGEPLGVFTVHRTYSINNNEIDFTNIDVSLYYLENSVDSANSDKEFGFSDWKAGVAKDITGLEGAPAAGVILYQRFVIKDDTMYIGDSSGDLDGSTAELRPTAMDMSVVFVKK